MSICYIAAKYSVEFAQGCAGVRSRCAKGWIDIKGIYGKSLDRICRERPMVVPRATTGRPYDTTRKCEKKVRTVSDTHLSKIYPAFSIFSIKIPYLRVESFTRT